jgi:hypothetical protein
MRGVAVSALIMGGIFIFFIINYMEKEEAIKIIKEFRKRANQLNAKRTFCNEHNFRLEAEKFAFAEDEIRRVCQKLEDIFDTGFVWTDEQ